jgi:hypothetical protein
LPPRIHSFALPDQNPLDPVHDMPLQAVSFVGAVEATALDHNGFLNVVEDGVTI